VTCSKVCHSKLTWAKRPLGENHYRGTCQICGGEAKGKRYFHVKTCSLKCAIELRRRQQPPRATGFESVPWGKGTMKSGYLRLRAPWHPRADVKGYVAEHRLVMEHHLGRYLEPWEVVHHRNGVRTDNSLANLEIVTHARHRGWVTCPFCTKEFQVH